MPFPFKYDQKLSGFIIVCTSLQSSTRMKKRSNLDMIGADMFKLCCNNKSKFMFIFCLYFPTDLIL